MKRHIAIITILIMVMSVMSIGIVCAASDDGSDAHSPSMSVESGDEPIVDESTTMNANTFSEDVVDESGLYDDEVDVTVDGEEQTSAFNPLILLVAIPIIGIIIWLVIRSKKSKLAGNKKNKTDKNYKSKH